MRMIRAAGAHLGTIVELLAFLWELKMWWLIPLVLVILVFAVLLVLAQAASIAPFIYPLF